MPRKKISTDAEMIEAIPDLEDNEQIVIEDTKRIRKEILQTERPKEPEPETVIVEPVEDEDLDPPRYSETSLAALIFNEDPEQIENQFCSVHVRRNPDSMTDRFLNPCGAVLTLPPLRNIELSAEKSDIEETIRKLHGGGHYFLQLHFNNRLATSWKVSLGDSPEAIAAAKAEKFSTENPQAPPAPVQPINPFDSFLESLEKQKRMKELLFGEEMKELETLRAKAAEAPTAAPQSETLAILEKAMQSSNTTLQDRLLEMAFPSKDEGSSHWIVDLVKTAFEHKEELAGLAQMVLGVLVPKPQPQGIEALLRSQPPTAKPPAAEIAEPSRSNFRRKAPTEPPKEPANEQPDSVVE